MGWFTPSRSSHHSSNRPGYARSHTGSSYSSHRGSSSSYYKRRPRDGYIEYMLHKFKRLLRKLYDYARRHPYKVFFMVIMPLISGGVLHKTARQFGIKLPDILKGNAGSHSSRGDGGYYGSEGYGGRGDREEFGLGSITNGLGGIGGVMKMAKAFM
jgi:hypothetical protein